jgi:sugar phosphate isomerase/epimerase
MPVTRRSFLATGAVLGAAAGLAGWDSSQAAAAAPLVRGTPQADKLGWRVGFAAYSFRRLTLFEALDKIADVGLHYVELFAWQKLSPKDPQAKSGPGLSKTLRQDLKNKAADCGVKMIGIYGVLETADASQALFEFAAEMGCEVIVGEPPERLLDTVAALTDEYHVGLALHNHPQPSHYWNPDTGLAALKGRSPRMGFCCDTGHWCRSGLDPVEMLKKVGPRVKTFHFKDLDQFGVPAAKDVVWGQGRGRIAGMLAEVKRQGLKPYFGIEWERSTDEPLETHARSVAFFEQTAAALANP